MRNSRMTKEELVNEVMKTCVDYANTEVTLESLDDDPPLIRAWINRAKKKFEEFEEAVNKLANYDGTKSLLP